MVRLETAESLREVEQKLGCGGCGVFGVFGVLVFVVFLLFLMISECIYH